MFLFRQKIDDVASAEDCQNMCKDNTECAYWTYKDSDNGRNGRRCKLYDESADFVKGTNRKWVSGSILGECSDLALETLDNCQCEALNDEENRETKYDYFLEGPDMSDIMSRAGGDCQGQEVWR